MYFLCIFLKYLRIYNFDLSCSSMCIKCHACNVRNCYCGYASATLAPSSEEVVNYLPRLLKNARPIQEARFRADRKMSVVLNFYSCFWQISAVLFGVNVFNVLTSRKTLLIKIFGLFIPVFDRYQLSSTFFSVVIVNSLIRIASTIHWAVRFPVITCYNWYFFITFG